MTVLTEATKVNRVDAAFGQLTGEMVTAGQTKQANKIITAFEALSIDSKLNLFDLLTK